jgi:NCS1 family nucleobase:cation symporter-1
MICDYFVIRRTNLISDSLYDANGQYSGLRWSTVFVLIIAVLPNLPGFINAAFHTELFPAFFNDLYSYAWFVGIAIAFVLYWLANLGDKQHV